MMLGVSFIRRTPIDAKGAMPETIFDNAKRILLATVLTSLCWALPGCQSITPTTTYAEIRFIDASYNAGGIDIYEGTSAIIYNMGFTQVSSYVPISPGSYRFSAHSAGSSQVLVSTTGSVSTDKQYTVMISNVAASLQETVFTDQSQAAPGGQIAVRVINEATQSGPYDVYMVPSGTPLIDVTPVLTACGLQHHHRLHRCSDGKLLRGDRACGHSADHDHGSHVYQLGDGIHRRLGAQLHHSGSADHCHARRTDHHHGRL